MDELSIFASSVSTLGVIATCFGAWYSFRAYKTANDIFKKGIQISDDKIINLICLELTTSIALPFGKFLEINKGVLENNDNHRQHCVTVYNHLIESKFTVSVPSYYAHSGDLLEVLRNRGNPYYYFIAIGEYIRTAERLSQGINRLSNALYEYIIGQKITIESPTLFDFFSYSQKNKDTFDYGVNLVQTLKGFTDMKCPADSNKEGYKLPNWLTKKMNDIMENSKFPIVPND